MIYLFGILKYNGIIVSEKSLIATFDNMDYAVQYVESCKRFFEDYNGKKSSSFEFKGLLSGFDDYELSDCLHNPPLEPKDSGFWL